MGIKAIVKEAATKGTKYPYLKESENGTIVLFFAQNSGVSVCKSYYHDVGEYSNTWLESDFKPFHGTVTLVNE